MCFLRSPLARLSFIQLGNEKSQLIGPFMYKERQNGRKGSANTQPGNGGPVTSPKLWLYLLPTDVFVVAQLRFKSEGKVVIFKRI